MNTCECDQCESLREENEKLKKQLAIAKEALLHWDISQQCCLDSINNGNNMIKAFDHVIDINDKALEQVEKLENNERFKDVVDLLKEELSEDIMNQLKHDPLAIITKLIENKKEKK